MPKFETIEIDLSKCLVKEPELLNNTIDKPRDNEIRIGFTEDLYSDVYTIKKNGDMYKNKIIIENWDINGLIDFFQYKYTDRKKSKRFSLTLLKDWNKDEEHKTELFDTVKGKYARNNDYNFEIFKVTLQETIPRWMKTL